MKHLKFISIFISFYLISILSISLSCKKEAPRETDIETAPPVTEEIDIKKIENLTGIKFKILKTQSVGYMPLHKFYWLCLQKRISHQNVRELAYAVIKGTVDSKFKTYHSFTIHFFLEEKLKDSLEKSECCARVYFLPEGSWLKVGRVPIDDYKDYELICIFFNEESYP